MGEKNQKTENGGDEKMAPGHANHRKAVTVEVTEEDDEGNRAVKRIVGRDAELFMEKARGAGITVNWDRVLVE